MFIVRSSMHSEEPDDAVFKNISRCSYPPDSMKESIKLQRANYPGQQVFYCTYPSETPNASASITCIVETAWEHITDYSKERIITTMTRWDLNRPLELWVVPFSDICILKNPEFKRISDHFSDILSHKDLIGSETLEAIRFFSEMFCKVENKLVAYKITSAFYNYLLGIEKESGLKIDGLLYPSANTEGAGLNLVLKKDLVDDKIMNCTHVVMWAIQRTRNDPKHLKVFPISNGAVPDSEGNFRFTYIQ